MLREEMRAELDVAFRESFPDRSQRLLREVDRWCREAPDPSTRDWRWFDDDSGKGKYDKERIESYRCSFCARSLLQAARLIGFSRNPDKPEQPRVSLVGYRHPVDRRPVGEERPPTMCNFCLDAYHERLADEVVFGSKLPDPDMLISDAKRALGARRSERAESVIAELERRRNLALPREIGAGSCSLCSREEPRVVRGPVISVCARCIAFARYGVSSVVAVGAR